MKNNFIQNSASESFKDSNTFILKRDFSDKTATSYSIQTEENFSNVNEFKEIQQSVFYDLILNSSNMAKPQEHLIMLSMISGPLASQFYFDDPLKAQQMNEIFLSQASEDQKIKFKELIDDVSSLEYVIFENFKKFETLKNEKKFVFAFDTMSPFLTTMEKFFFDLPSCFALRINNYWTNIRDK